jgi:transposase-like protein
MKPTPKPGSSPNGSLPVNPPDPEVKPKRTRRTYTAQQKLKILLETDQLNQGEIGAFLRRKGLYWSHLTLWRKLRDEGLLLSLEPKKRGTAPRTPEDKRLSELERENARLRGKLDQAEKIIDVQKKLCELFGAAPAKRDERH